MDNQHLPLGSALQGGKYIIDSVIGAGGFGITYLGRHATLGKRVCIKEFYMNDYCDRDVTFSVTCTASSRDLVDSYRAKFIKEAQNLAAISHPNIVSVSDVFEENQTVYYVMDYIDGGSLSQVVKNGGPMAEATALHVIKQVASALDYMHENQMCHFDVKPGNILLSTSGKAVLIDFGIAKHYDGGGNQTSATPVGVSAGYAPIEQYNSELNRFSPETDIYSLGATLFYLVTGTVPPEAAAVIENGIPELPYNISYNTKAAIAAAMNPVRRNRPPRIANFIAILDGNQQPISQPGYQQQPISQPGYQQQPISQPGYQQQPISQPGYQQQPISQPGYQQQPISQPGYQQQPISQPGQVPMGGSPEIDVSTPPAWMFKKKRNTGKVIGCIFLIILLGVIVFFSVMGVQECNRAVDEFNNELNSSSSVTEGNGTRKDYNHSDDDNGNSNGNGQNDDYGNGQNDSYNRRGDRSDNDNGGLSLGKGKKKKGEDIDDDGFYNY